MGLKDTVRAGVTLGTVTLGAMGCGLGAVVAGAAGRQDLGDRCAVLFSRALLKSAGVRAEVFGAEHADGLGACVILANHRSHLDGPLLLCLLPLRFAFVIKRELARIPFFGWGAKAVGYVPIDRHDPRNAVSGMKVAAQAVRAGRRVLVFPEGTRSRTGSWLPFKKGGVVLALEAQAPILPVGVAGTAALLPSGSLSPKPGRAVVVVGKPIATEGLTYADRDRLLERVETEIRALFAEAESRL